MKAIILAAGRGERMRPYEPDKHKVMLPLVDGTPIIGCVVNRLVRYGFEPVIAISANEYGSQIRDHFDGDARVKISEAQDPSGTAGEVYNAMGYLKGEKTFLVYYGDIVANIDLAAMQRQHEIEKNIVTLCAKRDMQSPEGLMRKDGETVEVLEKPLIDVRELGWDGANCAIFFAENSVLGYIERMKREYPIELDFSNNIFPALYRDRIRMGIYIHEGFYHNVGDVKVAKTVANMSLDF